MKSIRNAFTLLELLVVIAILAVVATAIGASLAGGIRAWDAARDFNAIETDVMLDLEVMQRDVMNSVRFYDAEFVGTKTMASFPTLVRVPEPPSPGGDEAVRIPNRIGVVRYAYDKEKKALFRHAWVYPADESVRKAAGSRVIGSLDGVTFEYYMLSTEPGQPGTWVGSWADPTNSPGRIRMNLVFAGDVRPHTITRTIVIPTVYREDEKKSK